MRFTFKYNYFYYYRKNRRITGKIVANIFMNQFKYDYVLLKILKMLNSKHHN